MKAQCTNLVNRFGRRLLLSGLICLVPVFAHAQDPRINTKPLINLNSEKIAYLHLTGKFWQIWAMNTDGSAKVQLTKSPVDKVHMHWGPDNTALLYNTNQGDTFIFDLKTGRQQELLKDEIVFDVSWSPNGKRLAFGVLPEDLVKGKTSLWVSDLDGKNKQKVAGGKVSDAHYASWINDGNDIVFRQCVMANNMEVHHDFWMSKPDGKKIKPIVGDYEMLKFDQVASPKGLLVYSSVRTGFYEIWTLPVNGGKAKQLTKFNAYAGNPTISPNEKMIAFDTDKDGLRQIYRLGIGGKKLVILTKGKQSSHTPVWSGSHNAARVGQ